MFNVLGEPIDEKPAPKVKKYMPIHRLAPSYEEQKSSSEVLETGIKVIDLLAPYVKGGKIGLQLSSNPPVWFSNLPLLTCQHSQ